MTPGHAMPPSGRRRTPSEASTRAGRIVPILLPGPAMTSATFAYRLEQPADVPTIEALHASLFGPERFKRAAYVLRDGVPPDPTLSLRRHARRARSSPRCA